MSTLFHGSALCAVDKDGSVDVPAFVAEALGPDSASIELFVGKHEIDSCLIGYDRTHLRTLSDRTERRRLADEDAGQDGAAHYRRSRRTFGIVEKLAPEKDERLHIPAAMRHLGKIERLALFIGTGDSFEIWNPDLAMESADEQFRDLAAFRMRTYRGRAGRKLPRKAAR